MCIRDREREGQVIPKPFLFVSAPNNKGIVENAAVHTNSSADFRIYDGGSADDHTAVSYTHLDVYKRQVVHHTSAANGNENIQHRHHLPVRRHQYVNRIACECSHFLCFYHHIDNRKSCCKKATCQKSRKIALSLIHIYLHTNACHTVIDIKLPFRLTKAKRAAQKKQL